MYDLFSNGTNSTIISYEDLPYIKPLLGNTLNVRVGSGLKLKYIGVSDLFINSTV